MPTGYGSGDGSGSVMVVGGGVGSKEEISFFEISRVLSLPLLCYYK